MTLFDGLSIAGRLLPSSLVAAVVAVAFVAFPNVARPIFMQAVHEEAVQMTSTLEHALEPTLRHLMPRHHGCFSTTHRCKGASPRH
jgi:hypothetical protein